MVKCPLGEKSVSQKIPQRIVLTAICRHVEVSLQRSFLTVNLQTAKNRTAKILQQKSGHGIKYDQAQLGRNTENDLLLT